MKSNALNHTMNWSIRILSTLVCVSCIISCKKDKHEEPNKPRLSKLIHLLPTPSKDILITEFIYDDEKRVKEIASLTGDSLNGDIHIKYSRSIIFYYNGKDKNPYKTLDYTETYHDYDQTGRLIRDSIPLSPRSTLEISRYSYSTNTIVAQIERIADTVKPFAKDSFIVADHNLKDLYFRYAPKETYMMAMRFGYDDKINPLSELNIASVMAVKYPTGSFYYLARGFCKNNVNSFSYGHSTGPNIWVADGPPLHYTYTYNKNNLPETLTWSDNAVTNTFKYYYLEE